MTSVFYPLLDYITAVSNAVNAVVTFAEDHDFTPGEYVSFRSSTPYKMIEINNLRGLVLSVTADTITTDINSTNFTPFVDAGSFEAVPAVAYPAGSGVIPSSNPSTVNLIDRFDNVPDTEIQ